MVVDVGCRKVPCSAALQEWEAALCAYELAAARFFAAGYLAPDAHQPAPDHALDRGAVERLLELRWAEECAQRRYVQACREADTEGAPG
jgi:hypothetical protein